MDDQTENLAVWLRRDQKRLDKTWKVWAGVEYETSDILVDTLAISGVEASF